MANGMVETSRPLPRPPEGSSRSERARTVARWALALLFVTAAGFHLAKPQPFVAITPAWVPWPEQVILWTGLAEGLGGLALIQPWSRRLRRAGALGLALYAVCVFPANVNHMLIDMARPDHGLGLAYHVPRLIAQPLLIWVTLWCGEVIAWPWRATTLGKDRES